MQRNLEEVLKAVEHELYCYVWTEKMSSACFRTPLISRLFHQSFVVLRLELPNAAWSHM